MFLFLLLYCAQAQKTERHVFLLDGLAICCKTKGRSSIGEYRFKEKINMRKAELIDLDDADGEWVGLVLLGWGRRLVMTWRDL